MIPHETSIRLGVFFGIFALMALWELVAPKRAAAVTRLQRWPGNLGIQLVNALLLRLIFPGAAVGMAAYFQQAGLGLFNRIVLPDVLAVALSILILDLAIYAQHVAAHRLPLLWRLHRMHHSDLHLDTTSGLRFHPIEILLSMLWKGLVLALIGAPPVAVLIFELVLNGSAVFNHANVRMPAALDRALRWLIVTPDMHRVHHSLIRAETDSNFGFNLPWWDWLFGTYRAQPALGHGGMSIGIEAFRDASESRLDRLLGQPFR